MREELKDFVADLLTDERWASTALTRLFSVPAGTWLSVPTLCDGLPDAMQLYQALTKDDETDLMSMWLPHPVQPETAFLVLVYDDGEMDSSVSIVTRTYLQQIMPEGITVQG